MRHEFAGRPDDRDVQDRSHRPAVPAGTPSLDSRVYGGVSSSDALHQCVWVQNQCRYDEDYSQEAGADSSDAEDRTRFFCKRFGDVLVACGKTFRVSACLPGTRHAAPDMQHLDELHRAHTYSPTASCMVLADGQEPGRLQLLRCSGTDSSMSRMRIEVPGGGRISACELSPDGAWLVIGTDSGEVWLADVAGAAAAAIDAASGDAGGCAASPAGHDSAAAAAGTTSSGEASAAAKAACGGRWRQVEAAMPAAKAAAASSAGSAEAAAPAEAAGGWAALSFVKLGSHGGEVRSCAVHPSSCYAATFR